MTGFRNSRLPRVLQGYTDHGIRIEIGRIYPTVGGFSRKIEIYVTDPSGRTERIEEYQIGVSTIENSTPRLLQFSSPGRTTLTISPSMASEGGHKRDTRLYQAGTDGKRWQPYETEIIVDDLKTDPVPKRPESWRRLMQRRMEEARKQGRR